MILIPALGYIVQERGDIYRGPVRDRRQDLADQRVILLQPPGLDLAENADRAQEMLVNGIVVVHRKLHHPDDLAKFGDEAAQNACLVHAAQHDLRGASRRQDLDEETVSLGIVAQRRVDALERLRHQSRSVGMNGEV